MALPVNTGLRWLLKKPRGASGLQPQLFPEAQTVSAGLLVGLSLSCAGFLLRQPLSKKGVSALAAAGFILPRPWGLPGIPGHQWDSLRKSPSRGLVASWAGPEPLPGSRQGQCCLTG